MSRRVRRGTSHKSITLRSKGSLVKRHNGNAEVKVTTIIIMFVKLLSDRHGMNDVSSSRPPRPQLCVSKNRTLRYIGCVAVGLARVQCDKVTK